MASSSVVKTFHRKGRLSTSIRGGTSIFALGTFFLLINGNALGFTQALRANRLVDSLRSSNHRHHHLALGGRGSASEGLPILVPRGGGGGVATAKASTTVIKAAAVAANDNHNDDDDKQSLSGATFNLVKAAVGSGVLALPAGVAAMGDSSTALVPAIGMLSLLGLFSAYSFYSIGRLCRVEQVTSLVEAWNKVFGRENKSSWMINAACILTPMGAALSYSIILGDFFSSLAKSAGLTGIATKRQTPILLVTLIALYPLCQMKSLAALAPVSMVGVVAVLLTAAFMGVRCFDGSYAAGGAFVQTLVPSLQPSFGHTPLRVLAPTSLLLGSMAATAYLVHFVAPDFYHNLQDNTESRFTILTATGFSIMAVLSCAITAMGFLTFGGNSAGMILNNYSTSDMGASACRFLMALSLIGSYPFAFSPMKSGLMTMLQNKGTKANPTRVTQVLLSLITVFALLLENVGLVVGLNGAMMGSAIIYIFPSVLFLRSTKNRLASGAIEGDSFRLKMERIFNRFLIAFGIMCAVLGGGVTLVDALKPELLMR